MHMLKIIVRIHYTFERFHDYLLIIFWGFFGGGGIKHVTVV